MSDPYPWPCDRRTAHGPHTIPTYEPLDGVTWPRPCPGVPAHPDTMIGRQPPASTTPKNDLP